MIKNQEFAVISETRYAQTLRQLLGSFYLIFYLKFPFVTRLFFTFELRILDITALIVLFLANKISYFISQTVIFKAFYF